MSQTISISSSKRYEVLDGLRGVAACVVMLYHFSRRTDFAYFKNGDLAVDLFFMLSGFVLAHAYGKALLQGLSVRVYLLRRFIRLYPMFLAGLVLGGLVLLVAAPEGRVIGDPKGILSGLGLNLFFVPSLAHVSLFDFMPPSMTVGPLFPANPPMWSLFFEVVASLGFLGLVRLSFKKLAWFAAFCLIVFSGFAFYETYQFGHIAADFTIGWGGDNYKGGFARVFYGFSVGMLVSALVKSGKAEAYVARVRRYVKTPLILFALFLAVFLFPKFFRGIYPLFILVVVAPAFLLLGASMESGEGSSRRIIQFLGWISYPLYCVHFSIGRLVYWLIDFRSLPDEAVVWVDLGAILVSVALSFAVATVLARFYDGPLRAFLSKRFKLT